MTEESLDFAVALLGLNKGMNFLEGPNLTVAPELKRGMIA
jgi:hypothetical protein